MGNKIIEAGFGNLLSFISWNTSIGPTIKNFAELNEKHDYLKTIVNALQTTGSALESVGKKLPCLNSAGKKIPATSLILSAAGLFTDLKSMRTSYNSDGVIEKSDIYSALGNITSAASTLALTAAAGAVSAPVALTAAAAFTVIGAVLTIASLADKGTIKPDEYMDNIRDALKPLSDTLGDAYDNAIEYLSYMLDSADNAVDALADSLNSALNSLLDFINPYLDEGAQDPANSAAGQAAEAAGNAANLASPLIVDLDSDGIETAEAPVYFDHDGNGYAQLSGWVGKDDGLLVLDLNGNHIIDDGSELFGNNTLSSSGDTAKNGFLALADYDSNHDGIINHEDDIFSRLQVWQDRNGDGVTDEGELLSMEQAGIAAIHLNWKNSKVIDEYGNEFRQQGQYIKTDGSLAEIADVWFKETLSDTRDKHNVAVSKDIASLPNIMATGNVSHLHQLIARGDDVLRDLVEQFSQQQDQQLRYQLADKIMRQMSGAVNYAEDSRGTFINGQKLFALEAFLGNEFRQHGNPNPLPDAAELLESAYDIILNNIYAQLVVQTHLAPLIDRVNWHIENQQIVADPSTLISTLRDGVNQSDPIARDQIVDLLFVIKHLDTDFTRQLMTQLSVIRNAEGDSFERLIDIVMSDLSSHQVIGNFSDDTLSSGDKASVMYGLEGNDTLTGSKFADTLYGNKGDDYLNGGKGNDLYVYARGDGHDTIREGYYSGTDDRLWLKDITAEQLTVSRDGDDMLLTIADSTPGAGDGGSVRLVNQATFGHSEIGVEWLDFADGTSWDQQQLREQMFATAMTPGDDRIIGSNKDDLLQGGQGDDYLNGGKGNDLYVYARGDGHDTIREEYYSGTDDRLWLKDITAEQLTVSRDGDDMLLTIADSTPGAGDGGSVRLINQAAFGHSEIGVEWLDFADGTSWDQQQLREQMFATAMTPGDDRIIGSNKDDQLQGGQGDDYLNGGKGNDLYLYARGDGHDTIREEYYSGTDDRLWLKDITAEQLTVSRDGDDMLLTIADSTPGAGDGGSVRLVNQAAFGDRRIGVEWVEFAEGTSWDQQQLREQMFATAMTAGNDRIIGSNMDDRLQGGQGDDYLNGGEGNDLYLYARGDGHDTIREEYYSGTDDRLWLKDITAEQLTVSRDGDDMLLTIADSTPGAGDGGSVRLVNQAAFGDRRIGVEWVEFAEGTSWDQQQLREQMFATAMTAGNDRIIGSNMDDRLQGGQGDDYLNGGEGNDLYLYARGDGHDTIREEYYSGTDDRLWLKDITAEQLTVSRDGDDMLLTIADSTPGAGDGGSVRLVNQAAFRNSHFGVEWVDFANGVSWNTSLINEPSILENSSFTTTPPEITQEYEAMNLCTTFYM